MESGPLPRYCPGDVGGERRGRFDRLTAPTVSGYGCPEGVRMIDWRLKMLGLFAATLALAVPASASGAVTIGSNLAGAANGSVGCSLNELCTVSQGDLLVSATAPGGLVAPSNGVVVR